jgi:hypothetical protein
MISALGILLKDNGSLMQRDRPMTRVKTQQLVCARSLDLFDMPATDGAYSGHQCI